MCSQLMEYCKQHLLRDEYMLVISIFKICHERKKIIQHLNTIWNESLNEYRSFPKNYLAMLT